MQDERPKKINCPVPGCTIQREGRKRILQHMRRPPHSINLNHNTKGPQGGNESLRRQKHTKRYARWLAAQGLPVDVTFFTNVEDELKSVDGWEDVHLSEDDTPAAQSRKGRDDNEDDDDDEGEQSSSEDTLPPVKPPRQQRRKIVIQHDEDDEHNAAAKDEPFGDLDDSNHDSRRASADSKPSGATETSCRPAGWDDRDEEGARNLMLFSQAGVLHKR